MMDAKTLRTFGRAISSNAELLMALCQHNHTQTHIQQAPPNWPFLLRYDVVQGDHTNGYIASNLLYDIHDTLSQVSRRVSHIPDIHEWMESVQHGVESYRRQQNALDKLGQSEAKQRQADLHRMVVTLIGGLREELMELEHLVDHQFGYVHSLIEKQKENEFFLAKAKRTLDKLTAINADWSLHLAGGDTYLFALLHTQLIGDMEIFRNRLTTVVQQMRQMLWVLRDTNRLTRAVRTLHQYTQLNGLPELDLTEPELRKSPFNSILRQPRKGHTPILGQADHARLISLVKRLKPRKSATPNHAQTGQPLDAIMQEQAAAPINLPVHLFMLHYQPFMRSTKDAKQSAKAYWCQHGNRTYAVDLWLWWVHRKARREAQNTTLNYRIEIDEVAQQDHDFSGNKIIYDVLIRAIKKPAPLT